MSKATPVTGSLDMLLDTMSNTFGGVCFIALLIAVLSVNIPQDNTDGSEAKAMEADQILAEMRREELRFKIEELKKAVEIQKETLSATNGVVSVNAAKMMASISSNELSLVSINSERLLLEEKLAKTLSAGARKTSEVKHLEQEVKELESRLAQPVKFKSRPVRTPAEHNLPNLNSIDIWLRSGKFYLIHENCMTSEKYVNEEELTDGFGRKRWKVTVKYSSGIEVTPDFFNSETYLRIASKLNATTYLRIYTDRDSFKELCLFRDDMIRRKAMYNWHFCDADFIQFVLGYDGRVQ